MRLVEFKAAETAFDPRNFLSSCSKPSHCGIGGCPFPARAYSRDLENVRERVTLLLETERDAN